MLANRKQTLLFSATFSTEIRTLARDAAQRSGVGRHRAAARRRPTPVEQVVYLVDSDRKRDLLAELVRRRNLHQVLVFTRTKLMAGRLASQLDRDGVEAISIHGDRTQPERERALADFKSGEVRVLVATDVAARGLDIERCRVVVNYELPHTPHDYVHRIGRTGRAGAVGEAISLVAPEEEDYLKQVNRLLKRDLPVRVVKGFEPTLGGRLVTAPRSIAPVTPLGSRVTLSRRRSTTSDGRESRGGIRSSSLSSCHSGSRTTR